MKHYHFDFVLDAEDKQLIFAALNEKVWRLEDHKVHEIRGMYTQDDEQEDKIIRMYDEKIKRVSDLFDKMKYVEVADDDSDLTHGGIVV
jgi:uncharacterized membrane protein